MNRQEFLRIGLGFIISTLHTQRANATHAARTQNKAPQRRGRDYAASVLPLGCEITAWYEDDGWGVGVCIVPATGERKAIVFDNDGDRLCGKKPGWYTEESTDAWNRFCAAKYRRAKR